MTSSTTEAPRTRRTPRDRARSRTWVTVITVLSAGAAALAPADLTGSPGIDLVERVLLAGVVTYVGAHGHRRSWLIAGLIAAVQARGWSLLLVLAGMVVAALDARNRRRSRISGALVSALFVNAVLWFPPGGMFWLGAVVGLVVIGILLVSGASELRRRPRQVLSGVLVVFVLVAVGALALGAYSGLSAQSDVEAGTSSARAALASVRGGDAESARKNLDVARDHLEQAQQKLQTTLMPSELIPGVAQQVHAVRVAVREALDVTEAADSLVAQDYDDLRYEGRMDLERIRSLQPGAAGVRRALAEADQNLTAEREKRLLPILRDRLDEFATEVDDARSDAALADQMLAVTPDMLGGDGTKRYLVVFVTPAELRGAGGFVGAYAELEATDGDLDLTKSGRITELIDAVPPGTRKLDGPAEYLRRWGRFTPQDYLQDATFSLDWPSDANVLKQLYEQSGGEPVDAVILADPKGLASILELTGPVSVDGVEGQLSADNAVQFLTKDQYLLYGDRAERGDVLEAAGRATFKRLTDASLPSPRKLGDALGGAARARHLQAWSADPRYQRAFELLDATGAVRVQPGQDALAVVQQNNGNNKIDAYQQRDVTYDARVDAATGQLTARVTVTLHNNVPSLDLPRAVVGNNRGAPPGTSLSFFNIMTPHTVAAATLDGKPIILGADQEAGLKTWETPIISVPPGGQVTLVVDLAGGVDLRNGYTFRYLPQPVAEPDLLTAKATATNGAFVKAGRRTPTIAVRKQAEEPVVLHARMTR